MFRWTVSALTMIAVLLHSVLGCCSHHAHADSAETACGCVDRTPDGGRETVDSETHACDHLHEGESGDEDCERESARVVVGHDQHQHDDCREEACRYLTSPQVKLPKADVLLPLDVLPLVQPKLAASPAWSFLRQSPDASPSGHSPGLRVHELTRVWLV